ncbi:MAG TPA: hypothetical protein VFS43_43580 [Polyangiaceae bacterium]|nr:hypothetical protein [Polyangiaceae bacterium]
MSSGKTTSVAQVPSLVRLKTSVVRSPLVRVTLEGVKPLSLASICTRLPPAASAAGGAAVDSDLACPHAVESKSAAVASAAGA